MCRQVCVEPVKIPLPVLLKAVVIIPEQGYKLCHIFDVLFDDTVSAFFRPV
jgi:hypothetical protein